MKYSHISTFVFRREVFKSRYFLKHFCDDTGLMFSILCCGKVRFEKEASFVYRQREKSIMHKSDLTELNLLELLLMRDCLDTKKMRGASLSRFFRPLWHCFVFKGKLVQKKYEKYLIFAAANSNKTVMRLAGWKSAFAFEKIGFFALLGEAYFWFMFYRVLRKIECVCIKAEKNDSQFI